MGEESDLLVVAAHDISGRSLFGSRGKLTDRSNRAPPWLNIFLFPSGQRTRSQQPPFFSSCSALIAVPVMSFAPRATASSNIILSNSLRRTCHVMLSLRFQFASREETFTYHVVVALVP